MGCCCCCSGGEHENEGLVERRSCRDVLFLLAFVAYWAGMFAVAGIAFSEGDPARLVFAYDSHGLLCGTNNTFANGSGVDLTARPALHYLNALDALDPAGLPYAQSVCLPECPGEQQLCALTSLPCTNDAQYVCPYYATAERGLKGNLPDVSDAADTNYWGRLAGATLPSAGCDGSFVAAASGVAGLNLTALGVGASLCSSSGGALLPLGGGAATNATVAGRYLQLTSQFPGQGPCYPVWASTVSYLNRCVPKLPAGLASSAFSAANASVRALDMAAASVLGSGGDSSTGPQFAAYVADISKGAVIVLVAGLGGGVALSLAWMALLRFFAGAVVWAAITLVNAALAGCALYAFSAAGLLSRAGAWGAAVEAQLSSSSSLLGDPSGVSRAHWAYIAYGLAGLAGAVLLVTLVMLRRVRVAVACIKVASQAVRAMPAVLLFPLLPFVLEAGLVVYWVAVTAVLYSAGVPTANWRTTSSSSSSGSSDGYSPLGLDQLNLGNASFAPAGSSAAPPSAAPNTTGLAPREVLDLCAASRDCYVSFDWDARLRYAFVFHLFGLLWSSQFVVGFCSVVVAGAIARFYWRGGGSGGANANVSGGGRKQQRQPSPVLRSLRVAVAFHLGSIALGSFVVALVQLARALLAYLDKKTKQAQAANSLARWAMCLARWLLWLLEKLVAFINRNAYVMVAVKGKGYCASAGRAVTLVVSNALRLAAVNVVGDGLLLLGKLSVAGACSVAAFALARLPYFSGDAAGAGGSSGGGAAAAAALNTQLTSGILPVALSALVGYVVAQIFFAVYEMAIDTVLLSFCEDCERNGGRPRFAPPLLMEAIGEKPLPPQVPAGSGAGDEPHKPHHHAHAAAAVLGVRY